LKITIIGTAGIPAKYGGFETLVEHLTLKLKNKHDLTVCCSSKIYPRREKTLNNAKLVYLPLNANGSQSVIYDIFSMLYALFTKSDAMLILGVSGCIFLPFLRLFFRKTIVINIDGLEWKREKWGKFQKLFLKYSEACAVKHATYVIGDNKKITEYIQSEYHKNSCLIPYGGDHGFSESLSDETYAKHPFLSNSYAFKVCRIEPENNISMILEAFANCDKTLVIVGNWANSSYGKKLRAKYETNSNIFLLDPIYNQSELNQLRSNCSIYIHGHSAGGTNPSLVEAMYLGLPVLAYKCSYNIETTQNKALYFSNSVELTQVLENFTEQQKNTNANAMKEIAHNLYRWEIVANKYNDLFCAKES